MNGKTTTAVRREQKSRSPTISRWLLTEESITGGPARCAFTFDAAPCCSYGRDPVTWLQTLTIADATVRIEHGVVIGELLVRNPEHRDVTVTVMPFGGKFPYGGDSPLVLRFADDAVRYEGPLYPPEPPAPLRIELPANSVVVFAATIPLDGWRWSGSPEVQLTWEFHGLHEVLRQGTAMLRLPARG